MDWSLVPRGPVSATVQGALALAALGVVGDVTHLDPLVGVAAGTVGTVGTVVAGAHRDLSTAPLLYRVGCWIGAGSWWTYTLATTVWAQPVWAALGVGALASGVLSPLGRATARRRTPAVVPGTALVTRNVAAIGTDWEARIQRVCSVRVEVTNVIVWPTRAGYDVHLTLPGGGVTRKHLQDRAEALATDACLPEGCGVEFVGGGNRRLVIARVNTVNRLSQVIAYPADHSPRSVLEPVVFGEYSNSDLVGAVVREESMLVSGKRGSGKTTLLQDISVALGRCADHLVWHLDLNGGGLTQPWIDVWLDGKVTRCPIDWAAPNAEEGKLMLASGITIAKHRKASYRKLKRAHDTSLLPVSPQLPQITIVVDEGAQAVQDRQLEALLGELQNIGRNEAVNVIISSLRPTSDLVPTNMRRQTGVRIQMYGPDEDELGHMFGWHLGIAMDQLAGKGTGFISVDGAQPRPFRAYNITPSQIEAAALAIAGLRPDLDEASAQAAGPAYATRLERMRAVFAAMADDFDDEDGDVDGGGPAPVACLPSGPSTGSAAPVAAAVVPRPRFEVLSGGAAADWPDLTTPAQPPAAPAATGTAADWPDLMALPTTPSGLSGAPVTAPSAPAVEQPLPEIVRRTIAAFGAAERMHSETLAALLGLEQADLPGLLAPLGIRPLPRAFLVSGKHKRGYALADVLAAADRIHRGEVQVPPQVAAWPAA
ncbi:hypothetical protein [Streptosporangium carneum]|uniref:hypothetical protein n=1 Tax=Streptosporangium carneum TaxID=47481 RepID=UPI0022F2CC16|nr:hypothetical protein [Streptosporangium carneum]